jgi:tyrosine-specific transport protein
MSIPVKTSSSPSEEIVHVRGIFQKRLTLLQGVALMVSGTIGAGILSLPYAIAQSGALIGFVYIGVLGLLMMVLNLMLGQLVSVQPTPLQLTGLARKYLGSFGGWLMTLILYTMLTGVLVVYLIGEGETLSALFGGEPFYWTSGFFLLGAILLASGMRMIKRVESVLVVGVLVVVFLIVLAGIPHAQIENLLSHNLAQLMFPYGIILFAFHGTTSMPEVYSIMKHRNGTFKDTILYSGFIAILVYAAFALMSVAVMGSQTTEIATVGLEQFVGPRAFLFGNIFAALAMGMSFLITSLSLRDSLVWDHGFREWIATITVILVPFLLFYFGLRSFVGMIDIVGGVFVSLETLLILAMYWRAYRAGEFRSHTYSLHRVIYFAIPLVIALGIGAVYSVVKLF